MSMGPDAYAPRAILKNWHKTAVIVHVKRNSGPTTDAIHCDCMGADELGVTVREAVNNAKGMLRIVPWHNIIAIEIDEEIR